MRKKLFFRLMTLCLSLLPLSLWAERVAPTMPTAVAPVSGESYYLYNVEADMFMNYYSHNDTYVGVRQDDAVQVKVTLESNGAYSLYFNSGSYKGYVYSNAKDYVRRDRDFQNNQNYWTLQAASDIYTIQRSTLNTTYYNAEEYLGWVGDTSSEFVYGDRSADGAIHWKFFTIEDGDRYMAERKLFHALQNSDAYSGNGWSVTYFEDSYTNRASLSVEELTSLAKSLTNATGMSAGYQAPEWNEYPILFYTADGSYGQYEYNTWALPSNNKTTGTYFTRELGSNRTSSLSATVVVDQEATFVYELDGPSEWANIDVYVDGVLKRHLIDRMYYESYSYAGSYDRFFEKLEPGTHTITWEYTNSYSSSQKAIIYNTGCVATPLIEVSLLEPGSLGTEVLYHTDHIKNVKRLKVSGRMNDDDWAKIRMMTSLFELDLKDAITDAVPADEFNGSVHTNAKMFMNRVILPDVLKSIGNRAFQYSYVEDVTFPRNATSIGEYAFFRTHLKNVILPDSLTTLGKYAFAYNYQAEHIDLGKKIENIPEWAFAFNYYSKFNLPNTIKIINDDGFRDCREMELDSLPSALTTIGNLAFSGCWKLKAKFPDGVTSIGDDAFRYNYALDTLYMPKNVPSYGTTPFGDCKNLKYAVMPTGKYSAGSVFPNCTSLNRLRLESPTVVSCTHIGPNISNITLEVPAFLVNSYKLDSYWYNAKAIEGFDTSEITEWTINNPLVLNHERMNGNPSMIIKGNGSRLPSLKINGDSDQQINDLQIGGSMNNYVNYPGQILSNCDHVTVNGDVSVDLESNGKYWYFFSLPFDIKVSEIVPHGTDVQFAVRYYDGANRAANGASGSWKNYNMDDVIPAGTGFIFQSNVYSWNRFTALDNANKQNIVANKEFTKQLEQNPSTNTANRGWNLIGNPYQCYYNNHSLNFTGPITVWNAASRTYTAYSTTDDDYAIRPNEAFFVQCPGEEMQTISFPLQGRQLNAVIESQNAAKKREPAKQIRQFIDIKIYDEIFSDQTRVVLNPDASTDYEINCDASKFLSAEGECAQIYTLGFDGTEYAINERPIGEGIIQLGLYATKSGQYTITLPRCEAQTVLLTDNYANVTVNLKEQDYGFSTQAGIDEGRFVLSFADDQATDIAAMTLQQTKVTGVEGGINIVGVGGESQIFTIDGRLIHSVKMSTEGNTISLPQGTYIVRYGNKTLKVFVK